MDTSWPYTTTRAVRRMQSAKGYAGWACVAGLSLLGLGCYSGASGPANAGGADGVESGGGPGSGADSDEPEDSEETDGDSEEPPETDLECIAGLAPHPLQRLTPTQYRNTLRDLFGDEGLEPAYADDAPVVTELGVRQLRSGAEAVLDRRTEWTAEVFPCDTDGDADDACAEGFIRSFGARAFRRPVTDEDVQWLMAVYESALYDEQLSFADAMDVVLAAILQAPAHVYLLELGSAVDDAPDGIHILDSYELASRLSYFLWDTMPDEALLEAAQSGELLTQNGMTAAVDRMLASDKAEAKLQQFFSEWLQLDGGRLHFPLEESRKDEVLYPEYQPSLQDAMRTEVEAFVHRVFFEGEDANLSRFFLDRDAYVNASLANLYGVDGPASDDEWAWVQLDPEERAGIVTRAAFLSVFSNATVQSPIRRGVFVLEELLCADLGEPPPNANDTPPEGGDGVDDNGDPVVRTVREDVDARTLDGTCSVCHTMINPAGFLFENYDAIGRWQDEEVVSGLDIDSSGRLLISDASADMQDAVELSEALGTSDDVRRCFAGRWAASAFQSTIEELDECTQEEVIDAFVADGDMKKLIGTIAMSDAFRHVNVGEVE